MTKKVETFFDHSTYTLTYVVYDENTKDAILIDPVLDYDSVTSAISHESVNALLNFFEEKKLNVHYILETHAHADHITSSAVLKKVFPKAKVAIGKNIIKVQEDFKSVFNNKNFKTDGSQFDLLLEETDFLNAGSIEIKTIFTPGHTPACCSFLIEDKLFTGDALFMPDSGTGRCDFPSGSAEDLYQSIHQKLYELPDETRVFVGHDYQPNKRELKFETSIGESKRENIHLKKSTSKSEYINLRKERDSTLNAPKLLLPSIQVNINAGNLPKVEDNGVSYLKLPLKGKI